MASDAGGRAGGWAGAAAFGAYRLGRRLCRLPVLRALVPGRLRAGVQARLAAGVMDRLPDRRYMEDVLLPALAGMAPAWVLDVGVAAYTRHYGRSFPPPCEFWTIDTDPAAAALVPPGRHVVGSAVDLDAHFEPGSLDLVLMNGPFGFGIDRRDEQERAVEAACRALRPGGHLLIGWDRGDDGRPYVATPGVEDDRRIVPPLELANLHVRCTHEGPPGLPAHVDFADSSHVYDWFRRR